MRTFALVVAWLNICLAAVNTALIPFVDQIPERTLHGQVGRVVLDLTLGLVLLWAVKRWL